METVVARLLMAGSWERNRWTLLENPSMQCCDVDSLDLRFTPNAYTVMSVRLHRIEKREGVEALSK